MDKMVFLKTAIIFFLSALVDIRATSCQEKRENWHPMYFPDMFRNRGIQGLIKARVLRLFPPVYVHDVGQEVVTAEFELECVYRGGTGLETSPLINITGFGHGRDCVDTNVLVGNTYLIFVEPFAHLPRMPYAVQEYNMQKGAFTASNLKLAVVSSVYECRRPAGTIPTTLMPWQSLTPIKQLPWIILPKDAKPQRYKQPGSSGQRTSILSKHLVLFITVITKLFLM